MANITSKTIKDKEGLNNYTPQCLNFDNRRPFNLGLSDQKEMKADSSPFKATEGKYWYKINGKNVTKEEYNAYKNEPGNMEGGGKTTNDPDASGNKAKIQAAREKLPKKSTVLTEAQTKVKNQGTKIKKKPPFKKKEKFKPHMMYKGKKGVKANTYEKHLELKKKGYGHSPLKSWLDKMQYGLTAAGMVPGIGNLADAANTAVSAGRAGYAKYKGDEKGYKTHRNNAAINAAAMVPGVGLGVGAAKLGKGAKALATAAKSQKGKVAKTAVKEGTKKLSKKIASNAADTAGTTAAQELQAKKIAKKKPPPSPKNKAKVSPAKPKKVFAGKGPLKPKGGGGKPKVGFKTGLEGITSKKVA